MKLSAALHISSIVGRSTGAQARLTVFTGATHLRPLGARPVQALRCRASSAVRHISSRAVRGSSLARLRAAVKATRRSVRGRGSAAVGLSWRWYAPAPRKDRPLREMLGTMERPVAVEHGAKA